MRPTLVGSLGARFSETARAGPGHGEARGDRLRRLGLNSPAVLRWRESDDLAEGSTERAQAAKAHVQADIGHAPVGFPEQKHRPLHSASLQIPMRRLAKGVLEGTNEVCL